MIRSRPFCQPSPCSALLILERLHAAKSNYRQPQPWSTGALLQMTGSRPRPCIHFYTDALLRLLFWPLKIMLVALVVKEPLARTTAEMISKTDVEHHDVSGLQSTCKSLQCPTPTSATPPALIPDQGVFSLFVIVGLVALSGWWKSLA